MSRALHLVERLSTLLEMRDGMMMAVGGDGYYDQNNDGIVTFVFKGIRAGDSAPSTASTKNTEDQLRARGLTSGEDYEWVGPYKLRIQQDCLDRDILDVIQSEGGQQDD